MPVAIRTVFCFSLLCLLKLSAGIELLKNHDMEITNVRHDWHCRGGCTITSSQDHYSGFHSVMVTHRTKAWQGLSQDVNLTPGLTYKFTAFIKVLNLPTGAMYESVSPMLACDLANGQKGHYQFSKDLYVFMNSWLEIGGLHTLESDVGAHNCYIYIQTTHPSVNYLIDATSLQVIPSNTQWKTEANARIEQIRKSNITVRLTGVSNTQYEVEIKQKKHEFAFGTNVGAKEFNNPSYANYAQAIYDNFEWAVLANALKWKIMEHSRGNIDYHTPLTAINTLRNHGMKVRGHNVFWGVPGHNPAWVNAASKQDLPHLMQERIAGVIGHTKGLLEHWDVNNENLHGDWFEQKLGDPNITMQMFHDIHAVDPNVKLMLNDYGVMELGMALPLLHQAKRFKDSGVPIYGIGIQSHIKNMNFDPYEFKLKLDLVAQAGLPIWITELSLNSTDVHTKAQKLDDILTLYFSHPAVEGVILWGFWDGRIHEQSWSLFEGPNVTPNAAGTVYQTLVKSTWRTNVTRSIQDNTSFSVRGFKGMYMITVKQNGLVVKTETFTLSNDGRTLDIDVGSATPSIIVG